MSKLEAVDQITLLLVDDEKNILSALKRLLIPLKVNVMVAESAAEGLQALASQAVEIVISDMRMPEMDGADFLAEVSQRYPKTKRVILTGYADLDRTMKAINEGQIDLYLQKPWEDQHLKTVVSKLIALVQTEQENESLREQNEAQLKHLESLTEQLNEANQDLESKVAKRTEELQKTTHLLNDSYQKLKKTHDELTHVLMALIKIKDDQHGWSKQAAVVSKELATRLKLSSEQIEIVYQASLLSRIGHLCLPSAIRSKAFEALSLEDKKTYKKVPLLAETLLLSISGMEKVAAVLRGRYEHFDGQGYPDGLVANKLPLSCQVLAVSHDYFELRAGLILPGFMTSNEARAYIENKSGTRYHPKVVEAFFKLLPEIKDDAIYLEEIKTTPDALVPGLVTSRDLYSNEGAMLVPRDTRLDQKLVDNIRRLSENEEREFIIYVCGK